MVIRVAPITDANVNNLQNESRHIAICAVLSRSLTFPAIKRFDVFGLIIREKVVTKSLEPSIILTTSTRQHASRCAGIYGTIATPGIPSDFLNATGLLASKSRFSRLKCLLRNNVAYSQNRIFAVNNDKIAAVPREPSTIYF